ncbi:hypothetical protein L249_8093 [Ophiocordyceps polyrhachis-furcata BCC 54312]|uniref:chitin synthase n=1 Tax=Ophiocordyceps polyrhachis-furcata BCC 54312 TaxID=1330021 RepID=A0A367LI07_9HYPO|nr:hypothetical protein L249_8093 [Ophiocordyceps polyrhachis-furcata BCC 54312]
MDRARKRELRSLNERAWSGDKDLFTVGGSLHSSLKKNTAFIKRLRTAISPATLGTFLQEIRTLSLHKYLSEIVSACYEGLCRLKSPGEVEAGVEIVSALHQRFGPADFTQYLAWLLGKGMATPDKGFLKNLTPEAREKEEKERIIRQRALLRVITELWLVGALRTLDDAIKPDDATKGAAGKDIELKPRSNSSKGSSAEPFPLEVLKDLLGHDRDHTNLPLLVVFVKAFSWDVLGIKPTTMPEPRKSGEEDSYSNAPFRAIQVNDEIPDSIVAELPFTPPDVAERFRNVLKGYYDDVAAHIVRDQKSIQSQARRNAEAYVKSGEVFEDRRANFEKLVKAQDKMITNAQVIADILGAEMPDLKESDDPLATSSGSIGLVKTGDYLRSMGEGPGIWADEDERRFYENLVDLKGKVPPILLEDGRKKKADTDDQVGKKVDQPDTPDATKSAEQADEPSLAIANKSIGAQVDALLLRLPELTNKDIIDQTAVDFCFLNSKASRNRLIKALTEVPKGRSDLLPSWSRLVATLGRYLPDVPKGLVDYLDNEFRSLQRRKEKEFLGQVRLSNIRYLAELTKFGVVPEHVVFHCLKVSLDDFSRMNIEILCNLIENCGRYLLKTPETAPRMQSFLETLQRKKSVQHIGQPERMLIDNAVYYVDPPERPAIEQKERTPMELFMRRLVYGDLTKRNYGKVLKQIRRFHWEEEDVVSLLEKVFSRPGKVKYGNIHLLAILLSSLHRYHPEFAVKVIDNVIESVSFGLEQNDFRFFQRRIAEVKYLGELYNYRMLEHPVIFDTMYKILTFGYGGPPVPGRLNPFDPPDDFFRIRLIATILETCGMFFNRGAAGKRLDYFLSFFDYYVHTKASLPMEMEFVVHDMFAVTRPQWKLAASLDEAAKAFHLAIAQDQKTAGADKAIEGDEATSEVSSEYENGDVDDMEPYGDGEDDTASDEDEVEQDDDDDSARQSDLDEDIVVTRQEEMVDPQEEAEFEREYAKMMAESLESRKFERRQLFDVPLPVRPKHRDGSTSTAQDTDSTAAGNTMAFSLLTKRGNRQQTRTVELPSDSTFAIAMKTQQRVEKEEQQRIKNLVLNYDLQQSEDQESLDRLPALHQNRAEKPDLVHMRLRGTTRWPPRTDGRSKTYVAPIRRTLPAYHLLLLPAKVLIVYTSIVGVVMLMACLEWFLWLAAFVYCLVKVFRKAEHWSIRLLCIGVGFAFALLRFIFLPIMVVTLPLPNQVSRHWPRSAVSFLQWFAFWSFAILLTVPWLFCIYQLVTNQLGRTKRIKRVLDDVTAPKVVIVMPCYREELDVLVKAINSVVDCDYPPACIHVFLSFDGEQVDDLYLKTVETLGIPLFTGAEYPSSIDVTYKAARITISRFPHGGKRHCQKSTFKLIDKVYAQYLKRNDNLFILFIDSDCILDKVCLQNFVYDMELSPGNARDMLAMTGVITSTTRKHSIITLLQDMEYIHGQLFERTVESGCGSVTCLPGALTMLRFSAFRRMAKYYFADKAEQCDDLFDFAKCHLGEDRWLTHLFMIGAKKRHQIQMCTSAFCKTEAVQTYRSLVKQRRRWFLGFVTNEVCMLTDWRLWKRYPTLIVVRFMQNTIRTTALLFFIMVLALLTTVVKVDNLPVGFIAVSLGLNWLLMLYFGAKLRRFKVWLYPLMFVLNPFFNWYYMVYGIFTAGQRTWGGPRADAAAADSNTTAREAVERAEMQGDELNVVPESFKPAHEARRAASRSHSQRATGLGRQRSVVRPPDKIDGKFSARQRMATGIYAHPDESSAIMAAARLDSWGPGDWRDSLESFDSECKAPSATIKVDKFMGEEDRRKYLIAQHAQMQRKGP